MEQGLAFLLPFFMGLLQQGRGEQGRGLRKKEGANVEGFRRGEVGEVQAG